jgi:Ca-activated chloride channel homolog
MKNIIFILIFLAGAKVFALGPPSVQANQDGIKKYSEEDFGGAFKDFAKALGKDAYNPTFHFNLGDAFLKNGEVNKALNEYDSVEKSPKADSELKFKSMFNAGNAAVQAKDIPKALSYYQRALGYKPDSQEVKTNIELALREQQGGGGSSDKDKDKDKKDKGNEGKDDKQQQGDKDKDQDKKEGAPKEEPKEQPKPFQSKALNENDVRRILEELKRQEEQIRAKQNIDNRKTPETPIEKDW